MKYDIVVVGAGILGISAAFHLKKNNSAKNVLVIDRFSGVGQGNTGRSNAMFRNTFSSSDNQLLADTSINFYLHVQNELRTDIGTELLGYLWLMDNSQLSRSSKYTDKMRQNGIHTRSYAEAELRRLLPGIITRHEASDEDVNILGLKEIEGAIFGPKCGRLDPDKLTGFYRDQFLALGGKIAFNTSAEELLVEPKSNLGIPGEPFVWQEAHIGGIRATGAIDADIHAETTVIAAGAWNNELLEPKGIDGHVKAKKRQIFSLTAKNSKQLMELLHTKGFNDLSIIPMIILPKSGVHFKGVSTTNEFWIQCEDDINRAFLDVPPRDFSALNAEFPYYENSIYPVLRSYFPQFENCKPKTMWAGYYSYNTLDFLPFVSREDGLIVVGGDSGSGIMKGDALGRIVDSVYREGEEGESMLFGEVPYRASKLGFRSRDVEREDWVL